MYFAKKDSDIVDRTPVAQEIKIYRSSIKEVLPASTDFTVR